MCFTYSFFDFYLRQFLTFRTKILQIHRILKDLVNISIFFLLLDVTKKDQNTICSLVFQQLYNETKFHYIQCVMMMHHLKSLSFVEISFLFFVTVLSSYSYKEKKNKTDSSFYKIIEKRNAYTSIPTQYINE